MTKLIYSLFILFVAVPAFAAPSTITVSGKVKFGSEKRVFLVQKNGATKEVLLKPNGEFRFAGLTKAQLTGASLQIIGADGDYAGPVVLGKQGTKVSTTFSGSADKNYVKLGQVNLKSGYSVLKNKLRAKFHTVPRVFSSAGKPIGAGEMGLAQTPTSSALGAKRLAAAPSNPGADQDRDGIPDTFDADDDGDLVLDSSDPDSAGLDIPYTSLFFDFRRTLNANVRDGLTTERVNEVVAGENSFNLTFFFSLPTGSQIDGGHVICDNGLTYCRRNTPLGYYGGVSESSDDFRDRPWSELLTAQGYPKMEKINLSGGSAIVASIQPRVSAQNFRAGDVYRVALTRNGETISSRSLALSPYFVSIPAIKEYDAGFGTVAVDYNSVSADSGSIPGVSPGDPIVLSGDGALTVTFWRPQRAAIRSDETGFYDWGNLHYGIVIDQAQATCAGYYSGVSSDLEVDSTPLGTADSPFANQGANLAPYTDLRGDRAAASGNTLSFTVNLKDCLARAGVSAGTYSVTLQSRGEDLTGGSNAAAQNMYIQIP